MDDKSGYAVFFFPQALEALGEAIKPYLQQGPAGEHMVCRNIDTGGAMFKMDLDGRTVTGEAISLELMVPGSMVRMIVSARIEESFGFGPRIAVSSLVPAVAEKTRAPVPAATPEAGKGDG
ncbi:MAG TPA: hypothetical protein VFS82_01595 [Lysobacter sp.]|nr:hypothetical protein [Lysobacter sp.]